MSFRLYGADNQLPPHGTRPIASGEEFETGSLLLVDAAGAYVECGANPALVAAVSTGPAGVGSGPLFPVGTREFPPGMVTGTKAGGPRFSAEFVGALGTPQVAYGVTAGADGQWRVDFAKTGATARVTFLESVNNGISPVGRVIVRFLDANVQPS